MILLKPKILWPTKKKPMIIVQLIIYHYRIKLILALLLCSFIKTKPSRQEIMASEKNSNAYKPNLGIQILDSFKNGWYILESIFVFLINLWPFILIGLGGFFLYKKYVKK